ncbi:hypothetical protein SAMN02745150_01044 [Brevinema andersonii]|uniref:Lipoprotein n=1 Tax=Brevinema andersonii TaxID=34097 RepID=A0A1I1EBB1_BREAD|nr:hypothetical protein [Brevinema andersonii]SFB84391.1 hypothetical protein SAMN02745150_01044 [Brevinema andersonii]
MKKLIFLGFFLTAACAVQKELANGNTITPPESENAGTLPDPSAQTTRDEWIQLVRGKTAGDHTFDNIGNWNRGSVVVYKFCDVAKGQNKVIYSIQNGCRL